MASAGSDAIDLARSAGLDLDPWQRLVLTEGLGERADGKWAARSVGLVVPRQNGKGAILEALELANLFIFGHDLTIHTAHEFKTAEEAFERVSGLIVNNDWLRKRCFKPRVSNGQLGIKTLDGKRLRFLARSQSSIRGFSTQCLILDEAFDLPAKTMNAARYAISAQPNPQIWFTTSTPGEVAPKSEEVVGMAQRAKSDDPGSLVYMEWGNGPDVDPSSVDAWALANPGLGHRVSVETVEEEYRSALATSMDGFLIERLGVWPSTLNALWVIPAALWNQAEDPKEVQPEPGDRVSFALDVDPDRTRASVAAGWGRADGATHVAVIESRPMGTRWIVELCEKWRAPLLVDPRSPAGSLIPELEDAGVGVVRVSAGEYAQACGMFHDGIVECTVRHDGDARVTAAVAGARKRSGTDGAWMWDRRNTSVDITPLVAVTLAHWGHRTVSVDAPKVFAY